jgi:hypothetical protein
MTTIKAMRLASLVTAINVLVASGFSIAAIFRPEAVVPVGSIPTEASLLLAMYAAARTIPLALFALTAIYKQATSALLILGTLAGAMQLLDAGIGLFHMIWGNSGTTRRSMSRRKPCEPLQAIFERTLERTVRGGTVDLNGTKPRPPCWLYCSATFLRPFQVRCPQDQQDLTLCPLTELLALCPAALLDLLRRRRTRSLLVPQSLSRRLRSLRLRTASLGKGQSATTRPWENSLW